MKESRQRKAGRPAQITLDVVKRVSEKVAKGVPLRYALAVENNRAINLDSWHKAIQRNESFRDEYEASHGTFVEAACTRLVTERDPSNLRWILERRHPADFGRKSEVDVNVKPGRCVELADGTHYTEQEWEKVIERARELFQERMHANGG